MLWGIFLICCLAHFVQASEQDVLNIIAQAIRDGGSYPDCEVPIIDSGSGRYEGSNCGFFNVEVNDGMVTYLFVQKIHLVF